MIGLTSGMCLFVCLELGLSSDGPYARPGIGFAIDFPAVTLGGTPDCGSSGTLAHMSASYGAAQVGIGAYRPSGTTSWTAERTGAIGLGGPNYYGFSAGGGVVHSWIIC